MDTVGMVKNIELLMDMFPLDFYDDFWLVGNLVFIFCFI